MNPIALWESSQDVNADPPMLVVSDEQQAIIVMVNRPYSDGFKVRHLYDENLFCRLWAMLPHRMDHQVFWDHQYKMIAKATPVPINTQRCCGRKLPRYIQTGSNFMIYCDRCGWHVSTFTGSKKDIIKRWERSLNPTPHAVDSDWKDAMMRYRHLNVYTERVTQKAIDQQSRITTG